MLSGGDSLMLHYAITPRYAYAPTQRGESKVTAPNWAMGMYTHPMGRDAQLGLRLMMSLDPLTVGGAGYPLLYQTGESWHGQPLHDRQHPHDLFSELSATFSHRIGGTSSGYLYVGYPGEPAVGPPTFMHRRIALDLPDSPISHHWMDSTHITFGVVTAGIDLSRTWKVEGSVFTGREPDENRYDFDRPRFDSQSGRVSFNPGRNDSIQVSYGFLKSPEALDPGVNQHRTTASWLHNRSLGPDANLATTLAWGQNDVTGGEGRSNAYLVEADLQRGADAWFGRFEEVQKSGNELVLPESYADRMFLVGSYTMGYMRDLVRGGGTDIGLGASVTFSPKPSALDPFYGRSAAPVGFQVMLRLRPSRMRMGRAGGNMSPGMGEHGK